DGLAHPGGYRIQHTAGHIWRCGRGVLVDVEPGAIGISHDERSRTMAWPRTVGQPFVAACAGVRRLAVLRGVRVAGLDRPRHPPAVSAGYAAGAAREPLQAGLSVLYGYLQHLDGGLFWRGWRTGRPPCAVAPDESSDARPAP